MDAVSLYSGAGGMDIGFKEAGYSVIGACEFNKTAANTFRTSFAETMLYEGKVSDYVTLIPRCDMIFGGPPCQGYSVAGLMKPDDPRSGEIFTFLQAISHAKPSMFVMENVDALVVINKWSAVLKTFRNQAQEIGYSTQTIVLNAADYGVAQSRKRMFLLGFRSSFTPVGIEKLLLDMKTPHIFSRDVLVRFPRSENSGGAMITFAKNPVLRGSAYSGMLFNGAGRPINLSRPSPTIAASAGGNKTHIIDDEQLWSAATPWVEQYYNHLKTGGSPFSGQAPSRFRRLTIQESAALQGFSERYPFQGARSAVYKQIGNAVPPPLAKAVATCMITIAGKL